MGSKKYNKLGTITKKKQSRGHREEISDDQWAEGRGRNNIGVGGEVPTIGYKVGSRMHCVIQGIEPIFCKYWL